MKKVYWGKDQNFGDILTKDLLKYCGVTYKHVLSPEPANVFIIGSIARFAEENDEVYGSGIYRYNENINPKAKFYFVRGPQTRQNIIKQGGVCPDVYGDAALLLPRFCPESKKEYEVGLTPNYISSRHGGIKKLQQQYPHAHVINLENSNPLSVAKEITKCKKIISGSLHGIICAHAYGIPVAYAYMGKLHGEDVKFHDYYQSIGLEATMSTIDKPIYTDIKTMPDLDLIEGILRDIH